MVTVVLHEPQQLANIAHVVRAMKNFGVRDLRLVAPAEYDAYRIEGIAHRSADVLGRVRLFDRLDDALADCVLVVACSARERTAKHTVQRPREAAPQLLAHAKEGPVALLFGREDKGLDNAALDRAHWIVTIPSEPDYPSLNLAHAVTLMLYEVALARGAESHPLKPPRRQAPPAPAALLEQLFADAERALDAVDFFRTRERELVMRTVREVVHRALLDQREAKLVRAMTIEVAKRVGGEGRGMRGER
jgi:TrmH family RNA methyltransferase